MNKFVPFATFAMLSGCASIISGTTQEIAINSSPADAKCSMTREGSRLQDVNTPGMTMVKRTKYDLMVSCSKPGYQETAVVDKSGVEPWVFGNLLAGGIIGLVVDLSTGAQNKYDSPVTVNLPQNSRPVAEGRRMAPTT